MTAYDDSRPVDEYAVTVESMGQLLTYDHWKGGSYTLLHVARNSNQRDQLLAVYVSHQRRQIWVRDWTEFNELVRWPDGEMRPRFVLRLNERKGFAREFSDRDRH